MTNQKLLRKHLKLVLSAVFVMSALTPWPVLSAGENAWWKRHYDPASLEKVNAILDINYAGTSNKNQTLDVLTPKQPAGKKLLPVIVKIHGGGFFTGGKSADDEDILPLVASGKFVGVTISYRLTSEAIFPAQVQDCKAAIRWVRANAAKYHIDPNKIGVIGGSAGANLASMIGVSCKDKSLEGTIGPYSKTSSCVQCVVDRAGPADLIALGNYRLRDYGSPTSSVGNYLGGALAQNLDKARAASPYYYVSDKSPPFIIIHGDRDEVVPHTQSESFYSRLKSCGVPVYFITVIGGGHGSFHKPEVEERVRLFLEKELLGEKHDISEAPIYKNPNGTMRQKHELQVAH
ncbi:MAG TPA: alpha/beta hydrolase [Planktothrix sp.]